MVVDLAVDGKGDGLVLVGDGLRAGVWCCQLVCAGIVVGMRDVLLTDTDNAQTLVDEDSVVGDVVAAPIGTAVLDLLAHTDGRGPELLHIGVPV